MKEKEEIDNNELEKDDKSSDEEKEVDKINIEEEKKSYFQKMKDYFTGKSEKENPLSKDESRTIEEIITSKGFKVERHSVKTEDGYILTVFRIPGAKDCTDPSNNPPVIFQHGILDSSDAWVCHGEKISLPFIFARNNFDVWISNSRGNKYCKSHEFYAIDSFEFWQFSFHEMGLYDIPAVIEYIKSVNTSKEKIIYFGHSQGTTLMFSGLTQKFEYYKKNIKLFVALAPVARLAHIGTTLNILSKIPFHKLINKMKIYEIVPNTKLTSNFLSFMDNYASIITTFFINLIMDTNSKECNDSNASFI